jgi:hypothetical protein
MVEQVEESEARRAFGLGYAREALVELERKRRAAEVELGRLTRARTEALVESGNRQGGVMGAARPEELAARVSRARQEADDLGLAINLARERVSQIEAERARAKEVELAGRIEEALAELREQDRTCDLLLDSLGRALNHRAELIDALCGLAPRALRDVTRHKLAGAISRAVAWQLEGHVVVQHSWPRHHLGRLGEVDYPEARQLIERLRADRPGEAA